MSWSSEVIIIAGYKLDSETFSTGAERWEDMAFGKDGDKSLQKYEDYFIDADPICGEGPWFFGKIIRYYDANSNGFAEELNKIITNPLDITEIQEVFHKIFDDILPIGFEFKFSKWITGRWV